MKNTLDSLLRFGKKIIKPISKPLLLTGALLIGGTAYSQQYQAKNLDKINPFIDTLMICTLTGLVIIITGAWHHTAFYVARVDPTFAGEMLNSSLLTSFAFKEGLSWLFAYGDKIITIAVVLFAVSTAISWSFYGDRSIVYLFGEKAVLPYKWVFVLFIFIGGIAQLEAVWAFGDAALGFMTIPNLLSIILLSGALKRTTRKYFSQEHIPYKKR